MKNVATDAVLDIPDSDAKELDQLEMYPEYHGGENQLWKWQDNRLKLFK